MNTAIFKHQENTKSTRAQFVIVVYLLGAWRTDAERRVDTSQARDWSSPQGIDLLDCLK